MIDWVTAVVPCTHQEKLIGGRLASISPEGEIEWQVEKAQSLPGSHESSFQVKSESPHHLWVSGNPAKWLQGHNLFGTDDLIGLMVVTLSRMVTLLGLTPSMSDYAAWRNGSYRLTRIDCTAMWNLPSRADVRAWLRAVEFQSKSRHGRAISRNGTVYFGMRSRRWGLKFYSKGDEVTCKTKGHALPSDISHRDQLIEFADSKLRGELLLRSMQLKKLGLDWATAWSETTPIELLQEYIKGLDMAEQFSLTPQILEDLPPRLKLVYKAWQNGDDLRQIFPGSTFYRYRRELLKHGIDINIRQPSQPERVIPLVRVLRPEAIVQVPEWAKGTSLYLDPPRRKALG